MIRFAGEGLQSFLAYHIAGAGVARERAKLTHGLFFDACGYLGTCGDDVIPNPRHRCTALPLVISQPKSK